MKKKNWYRITSKATEDVAEISIFGDIGPSWWGEYVEVSQFKQDFDAIKDAGRINVLINSYGGDTFDGIAIYNIIARERAKVHVEVLGMAASAASLIALAGTDLTMGDGSFFMIHNTSAGVYGFASDMREMADILDKISGQYANIYESRSGLTLDEVTAAMDAETWYTADEAVSAGFADYKSEAIDAAAFIGIDIGKYNYQHIPETIPKNEAGTELIIPATARQFEHFLRDAGFSKKKAAAITIHGFEAEDLRDADQADGDVRDADPPKVEAAVIPYDVLVRMEKNKRFLQGA